MILNWYTYICIAILSYSHRGNPANQKRYRKMMIIGYTCPTLIVLFTLIAEFAAPECALLRPRFGEEACFFTGKSKNKFAKSINRKTFLVEIFRGKTIISNSFPCFFIEPLAKFVWFHLPILILLLINAFVFCVLCYTICKLDREKSKLGIKNKEQEFERYGVDILLIDAREILCETIMIK